MLCLKLALLLIITTRTVHSSCTARPGRNSGQVKLFCNSWESVASFPNKSSAIELILENSSDQIVLNEWTLSAFPHLTRIYLNKAGVTNIEKGFLKQLENVNYFLTGESPMTLDTLEVFSGSNLETLVLDRITFTHLNLSGLHLPKLKTLSLGFCEIPSLVTDPLSAPELHSVLLNYNHLGDLKIDSPLMNDLWARNQSLSIITEDHLESKSLRKLCVSENNITELRGSIFDHWPALETFDIHSNPLKIVDFSNSNLTLFECGYFSSNIKVKRLLGNVTQATELTISWIHTEELDLSHNSLEVTDRLYMLNNNISKFRMDHNLIKSIKTRDFTDLKEATEIDLSFNLISSIELKSFSGLTKLEKLSLNNNCLKNMRDEVFLNLPALVSLNLAKNRIEYYGVLGWDNQNHKLNTTHYEVSGSLIICSLKCPYVFGSSRMP